MRQAARAVPDTAKLVLVQPAGRVQGGLHRAAAQRQLHLTDLFGPGVVVEVGADLDDVVADESCRGVRIGQAVEIAHALPDGRHGVQVVGDEIGLLVVDSRQHAFTLVHGWPYSVV